MVGTVVGTVLGTVVGNADETVVEIEVGIVVGTVVGTEAGIVVESVRRGALVVCVMLGKDFGIVVCTVVGTVVEKVVSTLTEEPSTVRGLILTAGVGCEGGVVLGDGTIVVETTRERLLKVIGGVGGRGVILVV